MNGAFFKITLVMMCSFALKANIVRLEDAIQRSLQRSAVIKMSQAERDALKDKEIASWLELGPRMSASYNQAFYDSKLKIPLNGQEFIMRDDVTKMGSITLTQPITGLFALWQKGRLDQKQRQLKDIDFQMSARDIAFKTAEIYLLAQKTNSMWDIAKASVDSAKAQAKDAEALFRAERIHKGDFLKLELLLSEALASEAKARAARDIAFFSLQEMIGHDTHEELSLEALSDEDIKEPAPSLDEALKKALSMRPELKQVEQGEQIASVGKLAILSKFFPSINFLAQIDRHFSQPGLAGAEQTKFIGFNASFDFFNSGSHIFQMKEAAKNVLKSHYQKDILKQSIKLEVMNILSTLEAATIALNFAKKAVEQAEEAYRIEKLQFNLGKSSATQLVLAATAKTTMLGNLVSVINNIKNEQFKLDRALGEMRPRLRRN